MNLHSDEHWMQHALKLASLAEQKGEVPVGALIVQGDQLIAEAFNASILDSDPTGHAEILALRQAGLALRNYRLIDCTLYVTLEPCMMCMGAIIHARIARLVFGAFDPKTGCVSSQLNMQDQNFINHRPLITSGICQEACSEILKDFFKRKRKAIYT